MTSARILAAFVLAIAAASSPRAEQAQTAPIRLNVKVQVSSMLPEIVSINVDCDIELGMFTIASGSVQNIPLMNGGFTGTVPVDLHFLPDTQTQCRAGDLVGACPNSYYTMINVTPMSIYKCSLTYVQQDGTPWWEGGLKPGENDFSWLRSKPGTPHVGIITGPLPPPNR